MSRDLYLRPYGRFFYFPKSLADKGHEVHVILLSYQKDETIDCVKDGIHWYSYSLFSFNPLKYVISAHKLVKQIKPDWIVGFSDTYYGILAQRLAKKHNCNSMIDAYDNYESYIPWFRYLHHLWRRSISDANLVTAAGPQLAELLGRERPQKPTKVLPMAADPIHEQRIDRAEARRRLNLPLTQKLIGYCGSISSSRGIKLLFDAFTDIIINTPETDIGLVLSGRMEKGIQYPPGSYWLGYLDDDKIPLLLAALDILIVVNKDSAFGNYSYPVKLYEAMQHHIPVIVTRTPATTWILQAHPELLVKPDDQEELTRSILHILPLTSIDYGNQKSWKSIGTELEKFLVKFSLNKDNTPSVSGTI